MKVVCCKNCGAKYQLDDNDDISTFECSSCAGDLEYEDELNDDNSQNQEVFTDQYKYDDSYIVQCSDCGLKYKIKTNESILDYECESCGGSLRYLDEEMNKELDRYLKEQKENPNVAVQQNSQNDHPEEDESDRSLKSFTNRLENFFSEEKMLEIADEEKKERELKDGNNTKTARTTIPKSVLSKFGKESKINAQSFLLLSFSFTTNFFIKILYQKINNFQY